ncbi:MULTISPECIES: ABC transporter permease [unclassified Burkholderia]|uniref:ABC transporter permease n=1 Tax=unclassified Burkholderia TaxID=2613784 RepID=UPI00075553FC|nr:MULTISPECIES: ABC transporter permease [unclassified Burkholderia]KUY54621.1 ABC transporter permease [Burkholderia sp. RF2-non_BP3]KUY72505.1 ABC transporter permease [Burkholderia sp. RF4-BP95]
MDFDFLLDTLSRLLAALPVTLALFLLAIAFGGVIALGLTWMRFSGVKYLEKFSSGYVLVFRGTPLLIQLFLLYYGMGQFDFVRDSVFWPIIREPFGCAVLSLGLCTAGYTTEIFRGGVLAVPANQLEAARAMGMSGWLLFRRVIAPVALRHALPAYSTEIVLMVKGTALASLVTVMEMTGVAQRIIAHTYRTTEVFLCAAAIYLLLNFLIVRAIALLEYSLTPYRRPMSSPIAN